MNGGKGRNGGVGVNSLRNFPSVRLLYIQREIIHGYSYRVTITDIIDHFCLCCELDEILFVHNNIINNNHHFSPYLHIGVVDLLWVVGAWRGGRRRGARRCHAADGRRRGRRQLRHALRRLSDIRQHVWIRRTRQFLDEGEWI